jgi:hypothetical protein
MEMTRTLIGFRPKRRSFFSSLCDRVVIRPSHLLWVKNLPAGFDLTSYLPPDALTEDHGPTDGVLVHFSTPAQKQAFFAEFPTQCPQAKLLNPRQRASKRRYAGVAHPTFASTKRAREQMVLEVDTEFGPETLFYNPVRCVCLCCVAESRRC